ncbi:MAG: dihydrolipoamide acetyltransferase family protein [Saprospiraceae bacterium]
MKEITLPSLGESVETGTIISILVKVGDSIQLDQPLMEVETDKVTAEVPAEYEGIVKAILVEVGQEIGEGTPIFQVDSSAETTADVEVLAPVNKTTTPTKEVIIEQVATPTQTPAPVNNRLEIQSKPAKAKGGFRASPLAKKFAREIGISISEITTTRPSKRISMQDVKDFAKKVNQQKSNTIAPAVPLPNFEKWGTIRRQPMSGISKATSSNMTTAWSQIPHAWLQERIDITDLETKRQTYKNQVKEQGGALTITAILIKVVAKALEKFPLFNASIDPETNEIIYKEYINIGFAVDTERGLLVPKIADANQKSLTAISIALKEISQKAKAKQLNTTHLEGATFTISNLGGIGTTAIFPIVNFPQVAILGVAASRLEPIWVDGSFQPRLCMPITIGFDHRAINGADAARFLQYLKGLLEDWFLWSL